MAGRGEVRLLIDTHYVLWSAVDPRRMEAWARRYLEDLDNEIFVSAISLYEISLKVRLGKLAMAGQFESDVVRNIENVLGYTIVPLGGESMVRAASFKDIHGDPFDRMIAAQAIESNLPLLSADARLDAFGVRRLKKPRR